ncbi:related to ALO1-D-arabinono-1,4-lactone oxidase [Phialocephala subalpina]|uniref:D-arabinono-1,4-lactone oxidase n=1 Tax=Phialocephala subalpina TaxID=576137 RepID=A0A1L7XST2_9HELO|nr:related to ALO1-D-arabinono-1,4-lactone oxidase [Phialocephala subalpina]
MHPSSLEIAVTAIFIALTTAIEFDTFDGPGFPACHNVSAVYQPTSVDEMVSLVKMAATSSIPVRASGKGHMWYDTMCSDDNNTIIIQTEGVHGISNFTLDGDTGSVMIEAGVTFFELADYLHARGASIGYALVNWNMTIAGAVAMGAHRSSLREASMVASGALEIHIIDATGTIQEIVRDENDDTWLAASTSLGLLGPIARIKFKIYPDFKLYAQQTIMDEDDVLNGDIYGLIAPYATANFWWWPYNRKFHHRYYDVVPTNQSSQEGFQSTFSITEFEAVTARTLLDSGKLLETSNMLAETIFFGIWSAPNFHEKTTDTAITTWPVYGWDYDVLIGGLYPGLLPEWDYNLRGYTLELAVPVTMANQLLKRVRELFDAQLAQGITMTATYRSGINIKFGRPYNDLLGQVWDEDTGDVDWTKGAIMFDFPSYRPTWGDNLRFNEPFYHNLSTTLINEFPCRPHWTKNTRTVLEQSVKNLDTEHLRRFKSVREKFDPNGIFKSIVGEIIGVV